MTTTPDSNHYIYDPALRRWNSASSDPAHFTFDPEVRQWIPANLVACSLALGLNRMWLDDDDLFDIKSRGFRCTYPNGEPITTGVTT